MHFEHYSEPVLPFEQWLGRIAQSIWMAVLVVACALGIGILGYHHLGDLNWIDATLEASMILGGMGPVATMTNDMVKLFASAYALLSGLVILSTMGILLAPWLHRMLHHMHKERRHMNRGGERRRAADRK